MENKITLPEALINFHKAFNDLATAWIESDADLSKDYPFTSSFDEHAIEKWIKTSLQSLETEGIVSEATEKYFNTLNNLSDEKGNF